MGNCFCLSGILVIQGAAVYTKALAICNGIVGLRGIGFSFLQRRHNRLIFWLMMGSGISLTIQLVDYLLVFVWYRISLSIWKWWSTDVAIVMANFFKFTSWIAYLLLLLGMWDLVLKERERRRQETAIFPPHGFIYSRGAFDTPPESFSGKGVNDETGKGKQDNGG